MEYVGAVRVMVFDESCRLHDLTEDQIGCNQLAMDVVVDRLDEKDEELEGRVGDMEEGYQALLALGRDQVTTRVRACAAITALTAITTDQQARLVRAEERMDAMREMILVLEHTWDNPIMVCQDMVFFELLSRPICLITRRLPITFLRFFLFSYDFMTL